MAIPTLEQLNISRASTTKTPPTLQNKLKSPNSMEGRVFCAADSFFINPNLAKGGVSFLTPISLLDSDRSKFLRDSRTPLLSGAHLLPYSIQNPHLQSLLLSMLPPLANHFLIDPTTETIALDGPYGTGFQNLNISQAIASCHEQEIPYQLAATCIEGGNCFIFLSEGKAKAIVGNLSLYLKEQGYFEALQTPNNLEPSLEAYRIARNLALCIETEIPLTRKRDDCTTQEEVNQLLSEEVKYRKLLMEPISDINRTKYFEAAQIIEMQIEITQQKIAEELQITLPDVLFIPQATFHIDMELTVTPNGKIWLHDEQKVLDLLQDLPTSSSDGSLLIEEYKKKAEMRKVAFQELQEIRKEIFQQSGIETLLIPGIFDAPEPEFRSCLNYCNGIFVKTKKSLRAPQKKTFTYITTGTSTDRAISQQEMRVHQQFQNFFEKYCPDFTLQTVPNLSTYVALWNGGIHCLTIEARPPSI